MKERAKVISQAAILGVVLLLLISGRSSTQEPRGDQAETRLLGEHGKPDWAKLRPRSPGKRLELATREAFRMLRRPDCRDAWESVTGVSAGELFTGKYEVGSVEYLPMTWQQAGMCLGGLPGLDDRVILVSEFWALVLDVGSLGGVIIHEGVHRMQFNYPSEATTPRPSDTLEVLKKKAEARELQAGAVEEVCRGF